MRVASTASTTEPASATPAPASIAEIRFAWPWRRRIPAAMASTSAASTPSRNVMTSASNMAPLPPLARADERVGGERGLPRLAHARGAEPERRLVQGVELALPGAPHVHDVEVAQDPQLVRRGRERGPEHLREIAHAQLAERERVDHLAARRVPERAEHAGQPLDVCVVLERAPGPLGDAGRRDGGPGGNRAVALRAGRHGISGGGGPAGMNS